LRLLRLRGLGQLKRLRETEVEPDAKWKRPLKVAWMTYFPIEWLPDLPSELESLPKQHPGTWQRVLWEEFQKREDLDLQVLALRKQFPRSMRFRRGNTTFHCIKTPPGMRGPTFYWLDTMLVARALKEIQPDLVHAWGTEYASAAVAGRLNYPALVTMQGIMTWLGSVFELNASQRISRALEDRSLRQAHVVTCESSFSMNYLGERYPHLKLLQVEHAPNPIFAKVKRNVQTSPVRFVAVGAFAYAKGADLVMSALELLKSKVDFEVTWFGERDVKFEQQLRAETSEGVWKRITFRHSVPPSEIAEELSKATLFIHASRADNSPNSVKEAVVAGVPVIATLTGGIPDYVHPEKNGFLFENCNSEDLCAKIKQALAHSLFGRGLVDEVTLAEVRSYLSVETMARKFMEAYAVALESDPRAKQR